MGLRCVSLALTISIACGAIVHADPKRDRKVDAKAHYDEGRKQFDLGKFDEAAEEFSAAYDLVGEPAILYNIAQSYRLGEQFEKSAQAYRTLLKKAPDLPNHAEIEGRIVEMDERAADQKRRAAREADEKRDVERHRQSETKAPDVVVEAPPQQAPTDHKQRNLRFVGYSLAGVTVAALGAGVAMSVLATKASNKVQGAAADKETFTSDLQATQSHGKTYDAVGIAMYVVAGAAAAGAAASLYFGMRHEKRVTIAPSASRDGGGLVLTGRF